MAARQTCIFATPAQVIPVTESNNVPFVAFITRIASVSQKVAIMEDPVNDNMPKGGFVFIIIGKGYEIKNVTFARGESTENRDIFVVTLQKDKSVAVCYFAAANWINLSPAALEDSKRCDVR